MDLNEIIFSILRQKQFNSKLLCPLIMMASFFIPNSNWFIQPQSVTPKIPPAEYRNTVFCNLSVGASLNLICTYFDIRTELRTKENVGMREILVEKQK